MPVELPLWPEALPLPVLPVAVPAWLLVLFGELLVPVVVSCGVVPGLVLSSRCVLLAVPDWGPVVEGDVVCVCAIAKPAKSVSVANENVTFFIWSPVRQVAKRRVPPSSALIARAETELHHSRVPQRFAGLRLLSTLRAVVLEFARVARGLLYCWNPHASRRVASNRQSSRVSLQR